VPIRGSGWRNQAWLELESRQSEILFFFGVVNQRIAWPEDIDFVAAGIEFAGKEIDGTDYPAGIGMITVCEKAYPQSLISS